MCSNSIKKNDYKKCAEQTRLQYEDLLECYSSELGTKLQLDAEVKTKELARPREMLSFVPTIVYNHVSISTFKI